MLGKVEGRRRRGRQRMRWLDGIIDIMDMSSSKLREKDRRASTGEPGMRSQRVRHDSAAEEQQSVFKTATFDNHTMCPSPCPIPHPQNP